MKTLKKIGAGMLAIMMLAVVGLAFASSAPEELTNGEDGGFQPSNVDKPHVDNKTVNIKKEITVYNKDEAYVYGPAITYTYNVTPASESELVKVTDQTADHALGVQIETTVLPGITTGLVVNENTTEGNATSATGTLAWANTDVLEASDNGTANLKNIKFDFSSVVFTQPGVYRYKISETANPADYSKAGVTISTTQVRYLDVYVMRSDSYDDTHRTDNPQSFNANDWRIYGYVCVEDGKSAVTGESAKTNGFVDSDGVTTTSNADRYFTYNVTITKDLVNDPTMVNHAFPFTVSFSNATATGTFQLIAEKTGTYTTINTAEETTTKTVNGQDISSTILKVGTTSTLDENVAGAQSGANAGAPHIAYEKSTTGTTTGSVKYIGIPAGTKIEAFEKNDVVGTTYAYTYQVDDRDPSTATNVYYNQDTSDNKATLFATATGSNDNIAHTIAFTNTLQQISPTGIAMRVAPYLLMLAAGIALVVVFMVKRRKNNEEDG